MKPQHIITLASFICVFFFIAISRHHIIKLLFDNYDPQSHNSSAAAQICVRSNSRYFDKSKDNTLTITSNDKSHSYSEQKLSQIKGKGIFIAALLYNNELILSHWADQLMLILQLIGNTNYSNIFISIHASGIDKTNYLVKSLIQNRLEKLNIAFDIQSNNNWDNLVNNNSSTRHRIDRLANLRNVALRELYRRRNHSNYLQKFDEVIFLNDVVYCAGDVIDILSTNIALNADMSCATDFIYTNTENKKNKNKENFNMLPYFYDNWVTTDINGRKFTNIFPYGRDNKSLIAWSLGLPFPVLSCWNGVVSIKADLFTKHNLKFRSSRYPLECSVSECELFARDLLVLGRNKIVVVPTSIVAYDLKDFHRIRSAFANYENSSFFRSSKWMESFSFRLNSGTSIVIPSVLECCPLRQSRKLALPHECFMETNWDISYKVLGLPWDTRAALRKTPIFKTLEELNYYCENYFCLSKSMNSSEDITNNSTIIPKNIMHMTTFSSIESNRYENLHSMLSWRIRHPCYDVHILNFSQIEKLVENFLSKDSSFKIDFKFQSRDVYLDLAKIIWIYQHGGIYADLDTTSYYSFNPYFERREQMVVSKSTNVLTEKQQQSSKQQIPEFSFSLHSFAAKPGHEILNNLIHKIIRNVKDPSKILRKVYRKRSTAPYIIYRDLTSGVIPFTEAILSAKGLDTVHIISPEQSNSLPLAKETRLSENFPPSIYHADNYHRFIQCADDMSIYNSKSFEYLPSPQVLHPGEWMAVYFGNLTGREPVWKYKHKSKTFRNSLFQRVIHRRTYLQFRVLEDRIGVYETTDNLIFNAVFEFQNPLFTQANVSSTYQYLRMCHNARLVFVSFDFKDCIDDVPIPQEFRIWDSHKTVKTIPKKWKHSNYFLVLRPDASLVVYPGKSPFEDLELIDKSQARDKLFGLF